MRSSTKFCTSTRLTANYVSRQHSLPGISPVMAKYGDESVYFDLDDMENTVGSWEMYGEDGKERYPALQEEFFIRAGQALNRRTAMSTFLTMSGTAAILIWGAKGSQDVKLPITVGPQQPPQVGPRGRI